MTWLQHCLACVRRSVWVWFVLSALIEPTKAQEPDIRLSAGAIAGQYAVSVWPNQGWLVQQFGEHVEIRFPDLGRPISIDRSVVDKDLRLADIRAVQQGADAFLRITLGCACTVAVRGDGGKQVVLEIVGNTGQAFAGGKALGPVPERAPRPRPNPNRAGKSSDGPLNVDEARARLMEQLLRAADAGLITMKPENKVARSSGVGGSTGLHGEAAKTSTVVNSPKDARPAKMVDAADTGPNRPTEVPETPEPAINETAISDLPEENAKSDTVPSCVAPETLAFPDLAERANVWAEISRLRAGLVGEFDRVDRQAARELTRIYLSLDLPEEARGIVGTFLPEDPVGIIYDEVAAILDSNETPRVTALSKPGCSEEQELWRAHALAKQGDETSALAAASSSGRALERLPQRLRERSAAALGLAATRNGDWKTARKMEALANRSAGSLRLRSEDLLALSAALAKWNGDTRRHRSLLKKLNGLGGRMGDEALIALAEALAKDETYLTSPFQNIRRDLGALAQSERGTQIGSRAFAMEVKLAARLGPPEPAISLLEFGLQQGFLRPEDRPKLLADLVDGDLYDKLERPLARSYLDDPSRFAPAMEEAGFRKALVESMIDIGVAPLAQSIVRPADRKNGNLMTALAGALLDAGAPRVALSFLDYVPNDAKRARMAAEAQIALGESIPEQPLFEELPIGDADKAAYRLAGVEQRLRTAINAKDWKTAVQAAELKMALSPSSDSAEQLAMTALEAGESDVPTAAQDYLEKKDPALLKAVASLFKPDIDPMAVANREAAKTLVESIDAEISLIEEMLDDG